MKRFFYLLSLLVLASFTAFASTVHEYTLKNGLQLFVKPDYRAPVVVSQVWYKVGGSYEHNGITGISHVLEHMMFRGTYKYGPGEFVNIIADNGGFENAVTSNDFTYYFELLSADKLPLAFRLEADRMRNLMLDPSLFKKEIQVVMEERRMRVDDNPQAQTYERFIAAAHISSPYHHLPIGWMSDLQHMTDQDIKAWYRDWYAPNNAIVVVVGDVDPDHVYQLANHDFGPLKSELLPKLKPRHDVRPMGERQVIVAAPAKLPFLIMGYNVPVVKTAKQTWSPYALALIEGILAEGQSGRLIRNLVRGKQVAAGIDVSYDPFSRLADVFVISATPAKGYTVTALQTALLAELHKLKTQPVSEKELDRIKAQVIAGRIYQKDSITNQANEIGSLEAVGLSWQLGENFVKNIQAVTPAQIQTAAKKYLISKRLTIATLKPLPITQAKTQLPFIPGERDVH